MQATLNISDCGERYKLLLELCKDEPSLAMVCLCVVSDGVKHLIINKDNYLQFDHYKFVLDDTLSPLVEKQLERSERFQSLTVLMSQAIENHDHTEIDRIAKLESEYRTKNFGRILRVSMFILLKHFDYLSDVIKVGYPELSRAEITGVTIDANKHLIIDAILSK